MVVMTRMLQLNQTLTTCCDMRVWMFACTDPYPCVSVFASIVSVFSWASQEYSGSVHFFSSLSIFANSGVCIYVFKPHLGFHFLKSRSLCALQLLFRGQARCNHSLPYLLLLSPSPITPGFYDHIVSVTVLPFTHLSHHPPSAVLILSLYLFD